MGRSAVGCQTSLTVSQISRANSRSVKQKVSGEYSNCHWVLGFCSQCCLTNLAPFTANSMVLALSWLNTTSRKAGAVALYKWTIALDAPCNASKVLAISSGRDWVMT